MPQRITNRINPINGEPEVEAIVPTRNINLHPQLVTKNDGSISSSSSSNTGETTRTGGAETNVGGKYSVENNQAFYDVNTSKELPSQTTTQSGKTSGMGAEAAVGTTYSWDDKAKTLAENTYQQKVLEEKQNMLTQRQEMEKNAQQYQTQADMQKYSDNQTADKVGWTGGYVLDQERQREYMKQSIQAQLYGAMELQKYGYDTAMAAARLSYDANLLTYAEEYYNQAIQNALAEGNLLGTYFSAEVKEMLQQYTIAGEKLLDSSLSEEEKARAQKIVDTINGWFGENNISPAGIKTAAQLSAELSAENQRNELLWTQYNAAMQTAEASKKENSSSFIMLDDKGNPIYDGYNIKMGDWNTIDGKEILENYLSNDPSGQRRQEFFSYLDVQLAGQSGTDFTNWLKANGYMAENGTIQGDTKSLYEEFIEESDVFANFLQKKFGNLSEEDKQLLANVLNGYDLTVNLPDGKTASYTLGVTYKKGGTDDESESGSEERPKGESKNTLSLTKTYSETTQDAMLNTLFKTNSKGELINKNFDELLQILDGCTASNPDTWDEDNGWWNVLKGTYGYGHIAEAINGWATATDNWEKTKYVGKILETISDSIGPENLELLKNIADKWTTSERDKQLMTETERNYYEQATNFMTKVAQLKAAYDYYDRNNSNPLTWDYVGDTWQRVSHSWSNMNSFGDFWGAVGSSINAVGTSVFSGIGGLIVKIFGGQW